jgi:hypothetical protein
MSNDENFTVAINELEYSQWKFYTSATDSHHHSTNINVALPPHVIAQIGQIVQSKRIPAFKIDQDFIRDAINHRLKFVLDHFGELLSDEERRAFNRNLAVAEIERNASIARELSASIEKLSSNMNDAVEANDLVTLKKHLLSGKDILANCGEPYYSRLKSLLDGMGFVLLQLEE